MHFGVKKIMKIRIMGTASECKQAQRFYSALEVAPQVKYVSVSELDAEHSSQLFRVYIDIEYYSEPPELVGKFISD